MLAQEIVSFDSTSPAFAAIRWLWFLSITGAVGASAFQSLVNRRTIDLPQQVADQAAAGAAYIGLVSAAFALAAAGLRLMAQSVALLGEVGPDTLILVTGTRWGTAWLVHTASAAIAVIAFGVASRRVRSAWWVAGLAVVAMAAAPAMTGHSAAGSLQPLPMIADGLHVLAAGGWVGGLIVMLAAGIPAAFRADGGARHTARLVNAFSPVAIACAGIVVLSGLFAAWLHLGSLSALLQPGYGRILSLKLLAFLGVAGFGAWNFLRVKSRLAEPGGVTTLRRSAAAEIALGAVLLLLTAVLVATAPPSESAGAEASTIPTAEAVLPI